MSISGLCVGIAFFPASHIPAFIMKKAGNEAIEGMVQTI